MRHENSGLSAQILIDAFLEHVLAYVGVYGAQRIIQEIYVGFGVNGPRQVYSVDYSELFTITFERLRFEMTDSK